MRITSLTLELQDSRGKAAASYLCAALKSRVFVMKCNRLLCCRSAVSKQMNIHFHTKSEGGRMQLFLLFTGNIISCLQRTIH